MKILYMGTPDYAVTVLKALVEHGEDVVAAITQTSKPKGRGKVLTPPPVYGYATEVGIPVYQPVSLKTDEFAELLREFDPELIIVAAYGKILPKNVLDYPKYGCINAHASILPEYRGAAPIQRVIMDGRSETGVTAMYMAEGLDTGDMIKIARTPISKDDTFGTLHDRLADVAAELIVEVVDGVKKCGALRLPAEVQDDASSCYAAKIEKADQPIDFQASTRELDCRIRALSPFPYAVTHTPDGKLLKIVSAEISEREYPDAEPGEVVALDGGKIAVKCADGAIAFTEVIPEGKSRMSAADFINGRRIAVGDRLS